MSRSPGPGAPGARARPAPTPLAGPPLARGRTAEVYAWRDGEVVKLFYDWCPSHWPQHEADVHRAVARTPLPIPRLLDVIEIDGRPGIVYERADGPSMLSQCSTNPWRILDAARQLAELHAEIHRQDGSPFHSLKETLAASIGRAETLPSDLRERVLQQLDRLPDAGALCHFDFHPDQVLLTAHGPVIIDWTTARRGHPLADVARTSILFRFSRVASAGPALRAAVALWRGLFLRTYLAHYLEINPCAARQQIATWMVPVAAGRLDERIEGETEPILRFIKSRLATQ